MKYIFFKSILITFLLLLVVDIPQAKAQKETTLYDFCSQPNCTDGSGPRGGLIAENGALYGTTSYGGAGGAYSYGTVFELKPSGSGWAETVLTASAPCRNVRTAVIPMLA